jgi:glycosyltransferase involved in cell wall biosynthesis
MPAFNRAAVIRRAIDSVLAQDFFDFELIVVDDGSSDATADIARGTGDKRVRVVELGRNWGSNAARNAGIRAASAPLIAFLDSDDTYLPHKLSTVVAEFDCRPKLDALVDSFVKLCGPGAKRSRIERRNPRLECNEEFLRRLFSRELWKPTSSITVKRDAAIRSGMFDETVSRRQDLDFLIRLAQVANCASTDEILWVKSWSPDGISAGKQFVASTLELVRRHPQYLSNRAFRRGLSRDLTRHLLLLVRGGQGRDAFTDLRKALAQLGAWQVLRLALSGAGELVGRAIKRRFRPLRESLGASPPQEPAKARRSASARS